MPDPKIHKIISDAALIQTHMHMKHTPQEPNERRVSMCLITYVTPAFTTHRKCVQFPEFKFGSTSSQLDTS